MTIDDEKDSKSSFGFGRAGGQGWEGAGSPDSGTRQDKHCPCPARLCSVPTALPVGVLTTRPLSSASWSQMLCVAPVPTGRRSLASCSIQK